MDKSLSYYRKLPYTILTEVLHKDGQQIWITKMKLLENCVGIGHTQVEAINNLYSAFDECVTTLIKLGQPIPEPRARKATEQELVLSDRPQQPKPKKRVKAIYVVDRQIETKSRARIEHPHLDFKHHSPISISPSETEEPQNVEYVTA
ncbi:MAG: hypothetical protein OXR72_04200 [Gemmatimonadota bacterium]|nr:hypothetical protein [Gemmatimonadota bacterium]